MEDCMSRTFLSYLTLTALGIGSVSTNLQADEPEAKKALPFSHSSKPEQPTRPLAVYPSLPCPETWRFTGEFLYFLPTLDDTYFAFNPPITSTHPVGERVNNDFGFNPGFRVGAEIACCKNKRELMAFYSYLNADQEEEIAGSHLWAAIGSPDVISNFESYSGTASSNLHLLYQNGTLNISQEVLESHGAHLYLQPGIEYAYLRLREDYAYQTGGDLAEINEKSRTWGVGPQLGLGIDYNFYQGALTCTSTQAFSITGLFAGSILMGREKTTNFQSLTGTTFIDIHDEHTWRTVSAMHARLGLNYLIRGSSYGVDLGVGYEFNTYLRALTRVFFPDNAADGLCSTNYYNFDLQGLYVSGAISF
jgi:hypothetical protein